MIVPYAHVAELSACEPEALSEMMRLAQKMETIFREVYKPNGMNLGMNLGRAAGASWHCRAYASACAASLVLAIRIL